MYKIVQTFKNKNPSLPPPTDQNTPALFTAISPKSNSNLDTNQGKTVDETLRKVTKIFNQTLLTARGGNLTITQVQTMTSMKK